MLYSKSSEKELSEELFRNPGSEYRGAPFWSWNCRLDRGMMARQMDCIKRMGFGGFFMHSRVGMATPYLSDEFMEDVRFCVDYAKKNGMLAYLYDEDKWASGFGGGFVTKDISNRQKFLRFTRKKYGDERAPEENGELLTVFDIVLDEDGCLSGYDIISPDSEARGIKYYVYLEYSPDSDWYNGQGYVDTMSGKAISKFIEVTHERYAKYVGDEFGKTSPAIFTDEPQFMKKERLSSPFDKSDVKLPFTSDFADTYKAAYNEGLIPHLPELVWELPGGEISVSRYRYHDHTAERFAEAYSDRIGEWCEKHGIALTGHMMAEPDVECQTAFVGDCMRQYRSFGIPGIDILADKRQQTTAKQAQSAAHQYGRPGIVSELYGVTNWDFDFAGHKLQGDWQAALGVTLRTPHLYWMSMGGNAKRDYPASIGHQSPWYDEYSFVEDHFARVNTAMTRGKPCVRIGVIHPVESYWLRWGPKSQTMERADDIETHFYDITNWLLFSQLDFDYICEGLLPAQYAESKAGFTVGEMTYDAVVIPWCLNMRRTTLDLLLSYAKRGGKLILAGNAPEYIDGVRSDDGKALVACATCVSWQKSEITGELEDVRTVGIRRQDGSSAGNLVYQEREDGSRKYVFIAHFNRPYSFDNLASEKYEISFPGTYKVTEMDTQTGETRIIPSENRDGNTVIMWECNACGSLLVKLSEGSGEKSADTAGKVEYIRENLASDASYTLEEPNVLLLDIPEFSFDGTDFRRDFVLRIDAETRKRFGVVRSSIQPWLRIPDSTPKGKVYLRFYIDSEIDIHGVKLAHEAHEYSRFYLNGVNVTSDCDGYYVDEAIKTMPLPALRKGRNELLIEMDYCELSRIEAYYLLGGFGVRLAGINTVLTTLPERLAFSDVSSQGLPFYGGNIIYHTGFDGEGKKTLLLNKFKAAALVIYLDGEKSGIIAYPPYRLALNVPAGHHKLDIKLLGTRMNTFGNIHATDEKIRFISPDAYNTSGDMWSDEYILRRNGILRAPEILSEKPVD